VTQDRRESLGRWIGSIFTLADIVKGVALLVMVVATYFSLLQRITLLEYQRIEDKAEVARINEKVDKLYTKIDSLTAKVDEVNTNVKVVQSQLENYGPASYVYHPYKGAGVGRVNRK
jgi:uncharacterized protein YlxW (UPF0749 family)